MAEQNLEKYLSIPKEIEEDNFSYDSLTNQIGFNRLPKSREEAQFYSDYWTSFMEVFSDKINELTFYYQENPTQIPLTNFEKLKNYVGANIKPKNIDGDIKEYTTKPILVYADKGLVRMITNKEEFDKLTELSEKTRDVTTRYVFTLEPLCYRSFVPGELIKKVKLKEKI